MGTVFKGKRELRGVGPPQVGLSFPDCGRKVPALCPQSPHPSVCYKCPPAPPQSWLRDTESDTAQRRPRGGAWRMRRALVGALGRDRTPSRRTKSGWDESMSDSSWGSWSTAGWLACG